MKSHLTLKKSECIAVLKKAHKFDLPTMFLNDTPLKYTYKTETKFLIIYLSSDLVMIRILPDKSNLFIVEVI